jgi:tight adherence protein B
MPYLYLRWKRSRRLAQFEEKFPEAIDLVARALRAGHAFTTGLSMVADEIPDPVGSEFKLLYDRQSFGMPLPDALRSFAERIPILDARFFATAVLTQREAGGNLSEVLDNLAKVVRERFKVKRQVRVISAHGRITGFVLVALPPAVALGFMFVVPEHMKVLVEDPMGIRMIIAAIVMQITGGLVIRKLVNIEY